MRFRLLDHWAIKNNELHISLMNYYVIIKISSEENVLVFRLKVFSNGKEKLSFVFNSLEKAITFAEDVVNRNYSMTLDDIIDAYHDEYDDTRIIQKSISFGRKNK